MRLESVIIYSHDITLSIEFYRSVLKLPLDYQNEDRFASFLFENDVRLGIKKAIQKREVPGAQTVLIQSTDIHADYRKMKEKQVVFYKELTVEKWGTEFAILDPDKNKIEFIQRK